MQRLGQHEDILCNKHRDKKKLYAYNYVQSCWLKIIRNIFSIIIARRKYPFKSFVTRFAQSSYVIYKNYNLLDNFFESFIKYLL